jgi:hypothetical protein
MENNWSQRTGLYWLSFAINFRRSCSYFLLSGAPVLKLCTLDSKSREAQVLDVLNGFAVRNKLPEESGRFPFQGDNEFEGDFVKDFAKLSAYVKRRDSSSVLLPVEARITRAESSAGKCTLKIALVARKKVTMVNGAFQVCFVGFLIALQAFGVSFVKNASHCLVVESLARSKRSALG